MFTGIITDVGSVERVTSAAAGRELRIACRYSDLRIGESIAVNGACLTVLDAGVQWFSVAAVVTTLGRTTIDSWQTGRRVNLERALRASDRLGGHIVQGHVDGLGAVRRVETRADALVIGIALPVELTELMVPHGSIAVDGVSLTVNALPAPDEVELSVIDFTRSETTLGELKAGDLVHVEGDVIGKYARRLLAPYVAAQ